MRAADALCEALKAEGTEHVFGIPGGANLPTYDALYDADLLHIQSRREQGAGHAAEGYAKASGRVGVAFATSGQIGRASCRGRVACAVVAGGVRGGWCAHL